MSLREKATSALPGPLPQARGNVRLTHYDRIPQAS